MLTKVLSILAEELPEYAEPGMCYPFANKFIRSLPKGVDDRAILVHGTVYNTLLDRSFPHAWVELDGKIYDNVFTEGIDKERWEEFLVPSNTKTYTWHESVRRMLDTGHHGPWE